MTTLLPTEIASREDLYESALDLLADGIALLKRDGAIVYVNAALRRLAAAGNEIRIERNAIEFASPDSRSRFAQAMSAGERGHDGDAACLAADFAVPLTIMRGLFAHGAFHLQAAQISANALMAYGVGLPAFVLVRIVAPTFYARGDRCQPSP